MALELRKISTAEPQIRHGCYTPLIHGLPDDLSMLCLARVPSPSCFWSVCSSWRRLLSHSSFQSLRASCGFPPSLWLYTLLRSSSGSFSWYAFDPLSDCWLPLPPLPFPLDLQLTSPSFIGVIHSVQCVSFATKLIMVAGSRLSKGEFPRPQLEPALECPLIFDTETRQWTEGAPFRVPRKWCACGTAFGKLYVASGCGKNWDVGLSKSVDMYDPEKKTWVSLDNLKSSKFSGEAISALNYGGNLHMVSGRGVFRKVGIVYNPTTGQWTDMPLGMRNGWTGPCTVVDERLIVLEETIGKLKEYDPVEDNWFTILEDEMLKNMEEITGAEGKICGIVRATQGSGQQDLIRIVDIRAQPTSVTDLLPPFGQIVALQLLSGITSCDEAS